MRSRAHIRSNEDLTPVPGDRAVLAAVAEIEKEQEERPYNLLFGASATAVAWKLGIEPARRLGRGAVKGSWSGSMAPALRVSPRLRSLVKRGLLDGFYDSERFKRIYSMNEAGRRLLAEEEGSDG